MKTRQLQLSVKPRDLPDDKTFKLVEVDLPDLKEDEVLVKLRYLSNDPAQRAWIDADIDPARLYTTPVNLGDPMRARGLAEVIESNSPKHPKGSLVATNTGWSEYSIQKSSDCQPAPDLPGNLSKTHYLGALGLTGLTAYIGLTEVGKVGPEDIVVVSGAAGATGSMVVQIAKKLLGCKKVIGIAGSEEKCRWVEKLGADLCLNYKDKGKFVEEMKRATAEKENFPTVYFDNVGGEILDLMLSRLAMRGRVIACGSISNYNTSEERTTGLKGWFHIVSMRLECRGFIVLDHREKYGEVLEALRKGLAEGKLYIVESETVVDCEFGDIPKVWAKLFDGSNQGKLVTHVKA